MATHVTVREEPRAGGGTVFTRSSVGRSQLKSIAAKVTVKDDRHRIYGAAWGVHSARRGAPGHRAVDGGGDRRGEPARARLEVLAPRLGEAHLRGSEPPCRSCLRLCGRREAGGQNGVQR
jgi:hypothetical protein